MSNDSDIAEYAPSTPGELQEALHQIRELHRQDEKRMRDSLWMTEFIRPEILNFAFQMELTMRRNDKEKGDSWKTCDPLLLCQKLDEESKEVDNEIYQFIYQRKNTLSTELLDLADCCMMLWSRVTEKKEE
ncbi:MAG: hypothetical protein ABFC18_09145 [Rikenellaceae bacterium]